MGRTNFFYNLSKKDISKRLFHLTWYPNQHSTAEVIEMYKTELKEVIAEQEWEATDVIVFPDDESDTVIVLQGPKEIAVYSCVNQHGSYILHDTFHNLFLVVSY